MLLLCFEPTFRTKLRGRNVEAGGQAAHLDLVAQSFVFVAGYHPPQRLLFFRAACAAANEKTMRRNIWRGKINRHSPPVCQAEMGIGQLASRDLQPAPVLLFSLKKNQQRLQMTSLKQATMAAC